MTPEEQERLDGMDENPLFPKVLPQKMVTQILIEYETRDADLSSKFSEKINKALQVLHANGFKLSTNIKVG